MAKVTSVLAQAPGLPDGHLEHRMELHVGLAQSHVDAAAYAADPAPWEVRRTWPNRETWHGELIHVEDEGWAVRSARGDNEPLWNFEAKVFRPGEYITLRNPDGEELIFRIVNVEQD